VWASDDALLVAACFSGYSGAWLPEADEIALQKLSQITLSTALRAGLETTMRPIGEAREGPVRTQTLDGEGMRAKTMLGFEEGGAVHGCFALCVRGGDTCRKAADGARLEGALVEPPAPSLTLRAASYGVHHPAIALAALLFVCVLGAVIAIATRPRPRTRLQKGPGRSTSD
jgi:hypothetical protein